jgi:hypothetical protein
VSITRLQQARQMYALGKLVERVGGIMGSNNGSMLVTPTRDGSRPGYYGPDAGHENDPGHGSNAPGGGNGGNGGNDGPQHSPHTKSGYTGPTNYGPQQPPQEIIGGKKFDVTPDTRDDRERARVKQSILDAPIPNITDKGISFFKDGNLLTNSFMPGDNPLNKPKFSVGNFLVNAGMFAINPALYGKYRQAKSLYTGAKYATDILSDITGKNVSKPFNVVENLTKNIGLKDKNVIKSFKDSLTNNLTSKTKTKTEPVINTNTDNDNNGINSLENANALQDEYIILLQKGILNDEEQVRFNMLKNMLGI